MHSELITPRVEKPLSDRRSVSASRPRRQREKMHTQNYNQRLILPLPSSGAPHLSPCEGRYTNTRVSTVSQTVRETCTWPTSAASKCLSPLCVVEPVLHECDRHVDKTFNRERACISANLTPLHPPLLEHGGGVPRRSAAGHTWPAFVRFLVGRRPSLSERS